jgi:hypothetical protein
MPLKTGNLDNLMGYFCNQRRKINRGLWAAENPVSGILLKARSCKTTQKCTRTSKKSHAHCQCVHKNCAKLKECQPKGLRVDYTKYVYYMKTPVCVLYEDACQNARLAFTILKSRYTLCTDQKFISNDWDFVLLYFRSGLHLNANKCIRSCLFKSP